MVTRWAKGLSCAVTVLPLPLRSTQLGVLRWGSRYTFRSRRDRNHWVGELFIRLNGGGALGSTMSPQAIDKMRLTNVPNLVCP